jgi:mannitol/fructose-specific phosphotransferase system IIA component (Ntr-type)
MPEWHFPVSQQSIVKAIDERERFVETYLGKGLGMPHARIFGLEKAVVFLYDRNEEFPIETTMSGRIFCLLC